MNNVQRHNPPILFDSRKVGFSQISVREAGGLKFISISGQVSWNENREVVGGKDIYLQTATSLRNVEAALVSVGAGLTDISALRLYILESQISNSSEITRALIDVFADSLPCATWIGVPALASTDFLIEIEPDMVIVSQKQAIPA